MEGFYPDKFRTGKAVRFDAEDGFGVRGFPEQLLQQQADAGLPLAALAGHDQHLLRLGRRDQEIAEIFLQGQNVLRDEQTVQKFQPLGRCGGIGLVFHGEPVQAEFLFRHKAPFIQKVGSVLVINIFNAIKNSQYLKRYLQLKLHYAFAKQYGR